MNTDETRIGMKIGVGSTKVGCSRVCLNPGFSSVFIRVHPWPVPLWVAARGQRPEFFRWSDGLCGNVGLLRQGMRAARGMDSLAGFVLASG